MGINQPLVEYHMFLHMFLFLFHESNEKYSFL